MKNDRVMVPPIKIQGIKTKLIPLIKASVRLEKDTPWIEPFMGSGVVGFNLAQGRKAVFSDLNPHVIRFYEAIKSGEISSGMVREYLETMSPLLQTGDGEFYRQVRERFNKEHSPLDFLFLNRSCFNGMIRFNRHGRFNVPYGHKPQRFSKAYITKIINQVAAIEQRLMLSDWQFLCQSFEQTIMNAPDGSFVYCDPPYIGRHVDYYDSWSEKQEVLLHDVLREKKVSFMVSTWSHNQYRSNTYLNTLWDDCELIKKEHFYHIGARVENRNPVVEAILTNYRVKSNAVGNDHREAYCQMLLSV